jgi:hypothetical protein
MDVFAQILDDRVPVRVLRQVTHDPVDNGVGARIWN